MRYNIIIICNDDDRRVVAYCNDQSSSNQPIDSQPCRPLPPSSMIWAEAAPPSHPTKTKKKVNFSVSKPESINYIATCHWTAMAMPSSRTVSNVVPNNSKANHRATFIVSWCTGWFAASFGGVHQRHDLGHSSSRTFFSDEEPQLFAMSSKI